MSLSSRTCGWKRAYSPYGLTFRTPIVSSTPSFQILNVYRSMTNGSLLPQFGIQCAQRRSLIKYSLVLFFFFLNAARHSSRNEATLTTTRERHGSERLLHRSALRTDYRHCDEQYDDSCLLAERDLWLLVELVHSHANHRRTTGWHRYVGLDRLHTHLEQSHLRWIVDIGDRGDHRCTLSHVHKDEIESEYYVGLEVLVSRRSTPIHCRDLRPSRLRSRPVCARHRAPTSVELRRRGATLAGVHLPTADDRRISVWKPIGSRHRLGRRIDCREEAVGSAATSDVNDVRERSAELPTNDLQWDAAIMRWRRARWKRYGRKEKRPA